MLLGSVGYPLPIRFRFTLMLSVMWLAVNFCYYIVMIFVLITFALSVGFNVLLFLPAFAFKTDKLTDLSYSLTFIFLAVMSYIISGGSQLHKILLACVIIWAARLGLFLFNRIRAMKRDKRFDDMRDNFQKFLGFWVLQGITVPIVLIAAVLAWHSDIGEVGTVTYLGLVVFAVGLLTEATADYQKYRFNKTNKGKVWIDTGIWRISRHPNYLGEMLVWVGVYFVAYNGLLDANRIYGLASPLYIICLLLFVSGVPLLEDAADAKWGKNKDYQTYKKEVPVLVPTGSSIKRLINN